MQFGVSGNGLIWYAVVDFLLLAVALFGIVSFLNSQKGLRYLGIALIAAVALTASAFLRFPGVHIASQAVLLAMLVSFPVIFHEEWQRLLGGTPQLVPGYLSKLSQGLIAASVAAVVVFLGSGGLVKIAELPSEITVRAVNLPDGMAANFGSGKAVRVIVSAPRDIWSELNEQSFSATIDVAARGEGTYDLDIIATSSLDTVKIVRTQPAKAVVTIEPVIKKTVPVAVRTSGAAGDQLIPGDPAVEPDKVEIAGAKAVINDISQVYAQIKLNGETETVELDVALTALNSAGEVIPSVEMTPPSVKVRLPLVKAGNAKTLPVRPVVTGTPAIGYWVESVTVEPAIVTVQGTADVLLPLKEINTAAVTIGAISQTTTKTANLDLPPGVSLSNDGQTVKIVITLKKTDTSKMINPEIVYDGLAASLKVGAINPTSIATVVTGASDVLQSLIGSAVKLKLDLAAYKSAGTYSVPIKNEYFVFPAGVGLSSFLPSAIDVTLEDR